MRFLVAAALLGACANTPAPAGPAQQLSPDGAVYESCDTICLRPSDCEIGFASDGICPPGFRCAFRFQCVLDGGSD